MRRPLTAVILLYCAGILFGTLPILLPHLFVLALALALIFPIWKNGSRIILAALIFLAGWINESQRTAIIAPCDLRTILPQDAQLAVVRGKLTETPRHRVHDVRSREVWSSIARIEVSQVRLGNAAWQPAFGSVMSETKDYLTNSIFAGQAVEVSGILMRPSGPVAEGLFDYRTYLEQQGIYHELKVSKSNDWTIISSPPLPPVADRFCEWARERIAFGLPKRDQTLELEWALTLGWKAALTPEVSEPFMKAATYHIFAVDGLRIGLVAAIFLTSLRALGVRRQYSALITMPIIFFYAALTGWPASAVRAIVMLVVVFGSWILKRPGDLVNSLFAAALVILVWDPLQIFQAGFQLSFFVVLCIILILPFFESLGNRLLQTDPLQIQEALPAWKTPWRFIARRTVDLFMTSIAAWLGSIPLAAYYFHLITPMSGPANMFAVPLCVLVLIFNIASLMLGWVPFAAVILNWAGWYCMKLICLTSNWSAHWPAAFYYVCAPQLHTVVIFYAILLAAFTGWMFEGKWKHLKIATAIILILIDCGIWWNSRQPTTITIVPLNSSYCVYASESNGSADWLIDCGNEPDSDRVVKPFLQAHGVNRLDNLVLTHGEIHYSGGAGLICSNFMPRRILTSPERYRSTGYREFIAQPDIHRVLNKDTKSGEHFGPWTTIINDDVKGTPKASDNLMVLRGDFGCVKLLLLGDLSHVGQRALLSSTNNLQADILVWAMGRNLDDFPGDVFFERIHPQTLIAADSGDTVSNRDRDEIRRRMAIRGTTLLFTSECDAVTLQVQPNIWRLKTMRQPP